MSLRLLKMLYPFILEMPFNGIIVLILLSAIHEKELAQAWCDCFSLTWKPSDEDFWAKQKESTQDFLPMLHWQNNCLSWHDSAFKNPFSVDFSGSKIVKRMRNYQHEALIRAVRIKQERYTICDATAGFGEDGMILSQLSQPLTMLEKNPVIAALLLNGLLRYFKIPDRRPTSINDLNRNLTFTFDDSIEHLQSHQYDVVYLDPMFKGGYKGQIKKKAQVLNQLAKDFDDEALLNVALSAANHKVVVKRAAKANFLLKKPHYSIKAGVVRFDVYSNH